MNEVIAAAWHAEEALLTADVRRDPGRLGELLAQDFFEIGQSGRRWSREEIIASLVSDSGPDQLASITERKTMMIDPETVLLSYLLEFDNRVSQRTSLWRLNAGSVQCLFHQGTPAPND